MGTNLKDVHCPLCGVLNKIDSESRICRCHVCDSSFIVDIDGKTKDVMIKKTCPLCASPIYFKEGDLECVCNFCDNIIKLK